MHPSIGDLGGPSAYGGMLVFACVAAGWLAHRRAHAAGWDASHVDLALPLAFLAGALSTKLLALLVFHRLLLFPLVLVAVPVLIAYCRWARLPVLPLFDVLGPPLLLWVACLRIGCFLGGCCWGDLVGDVAQLAESTRAQVASLPSVDSLLGLVAVSFPAGSLTAQQHESLGLIHGGPSLAVVPTQLIEAAAALALCAAAVRVEHYLRKPGMLALCIVAAYATTRFWIEYLRADNAILAAGLTGNQVVCAALLLVVLVTWAKFKLCRRWSRHATGEPIAGP